MQTPKYDQHTDKELKSFTRVMAGFFALLASFFFWRADYSVSDLVIVFAAISGTWLMWGLLHSRSTKPLYHGWMWLAFCMNFVMTRLILSIMFFGIVLPTSLITRLVGKDFLGNKSQDSYWKSREKSPDPKHFENLFS
jgi:hypothetical protein